MVILCHTVKMGLVFVLKQHIKLTVKLPQFHQILIIFHHVSSFVKSSLLLIMFFFLPGFFFGADKKGCFWTAKDFKHFSYPLVITNGWETLQISWASNNVGHHRTTELHVFFFFQRAIFEPPILGTPKSHSHHSPMAIVMAGRIPGDWVGSQLGT